MQIVIAMKYRHKNRLLSYIPFHSLHSFHFADCFYNSITHGLDCKERPCVKKDFFKVGLYPKAYALGFAVRLFLSKKKANCYRESSNGSMRDSGLMKES
jgi:hypothetical protein